MHRLRNAHSALSEYGLVARLCLVAIGVAASTTAATTVRAENCGSVSAGWNVPTGGAVYTSGPGPFYAAFTAIGETHSHSMLSRGPDSWVTQATSDTPPVSSPLSCSTPIQSGFLSNSTPGMEWIGQGAAYNQLYGDGLYTLGYSPGTGSWNGPNAPALLGNYWGGPGIGWSDVSVAGDEGTLYRNTYDGRLMTYGWYQLKNIQGTSNGTPGNDNGVVCSTSLAFWQHDALSPNAGNQLAGQTFINAYGQTQDWIYSGDVWPRGYGAAAVRNAASAMWNAIYNECYAQTQGMFSSFGKALSTVAADVGLFGYCFGAQNYYDWDVGRLCQNAANQMLNTFASDQYADSGWDWQTNAPATNVDGYAAVSISPDDIFGYDSNGTGAPTNGNGASIWGATPGYTVQWNAGGYDYSCWD